VNEGSVLRAVVAAIHVVAVVVELGVGALLLLLWIGPEVRPDSAAPVSTSTAMLGLVFAAAAVLTAAGLALWLLGRGSSLVLGADALFTIPICVFVSPLLGLGLAVLLIYPASSGRARRRDHRRR